MIIPNKLGKEGKIIGITIHTDKEELISSRTTDWKIRMMEYGNNRLLDMRHIKF